MVSSVFGTFYAAVITKIVIEFGTNEVMLGLLIARHILSQLRYQLVIVLEMSNGIIWQEMQQEPELCTWTGFDKHNVTILFTTLERLVFFHFGRFLIESVHINQAYYVIVAFG